MTFIVPIPDLGAIGLAHIETDTHLRFITKSTPPCNEDMKPVLASRPTRRISHQKQSGSQSRSGSWAAAEAQTRGRSRNMVIHVAGSSKRNRAPSIRE